ncbi:MAG: hypothetical protein J0L93_07220 [Deltaproteobacteria bacterium]|nr:hypothetical protein [Deltaproteobacteria bacterium]
MKPLLKYLSLFIFIFLTMTGLTQAALADSEDLPKTSSKIVEVPALPHPLEDRARSTMDIILENNQREKLSLVGEVSFLARSTAFIFLPYILNGLSHIDYTIERSPSIAIYENQNHDLYAFRNFGQLMKIDKNFVNASQLEALTESLKKNNNLSDGTAYYLDLKGNIRGEDGVVIIQASDEGAEMLADDLMPSPKALSERFYNEMSKDIKVDFNPAQKQEVNSEAQLSDFMKEVDAALKNLEKLRAEKYPQVEMKGIIGAGSSNSFKGAIRYTEGGHKARGVGELRNPKTKLGGFQPSGERIDQRVEENEDLLEPTPEDAKK